MFDLERIKVRFKNHVATFTDYDTIKILDFKNPKSNDYRIRFLFEEDWCRLHISGDLGHLIAWNYNNMVYEKFSDFVNNTGYFEGKVECHDRPFYYYNVDVAKKELIEDVDWENAYLFDGSAYDTQEEYTEAMLDEILSDFSDETGLSYAGYTKLCEIDPSWYGSECTYGRQETGILDVYMLAFKLAQEQLNSKEGE